MRLTTYLSDGMAHEILSVDSVEAARDALKGKFSCNALNERERGEVIEFFDPNREVNVWAQGDDTDELGGLIGRLETISPSCHDGKTNLSPLIPALGFQAQDSTEGIA